MTISNKTTLVEFVRILSFGSTVSDCMMEARDIAPLIACAMIFGVPIIAILTSHQRKMAELIHGKQGQLPAQDLAPIYHELKNLRDSINSLSMNVDSLRHEVKAQSELSERLRVGE
ncbi:MAG: hypothetical protein WCK51_13310 [Armatimonadota bacterium]